MSPLVYWILFSILIALLVIFLSCLIFNLVVDFCLVSPQEPVKYQSSNTEEDYRLNKYQFDRHDVEDLTRIEGNFKTALPNVTLTNEVEKTGVDRLLKKKLRQSSLSNIYEEDGSKHSINSISSVHSSHPEEIVVKEITKISQSVDNLEFCDPSGIDVLKEIHKIEDEAKSVDKELDYFVGSTNDVKYYEINENLLRLMISLSNIVCESEELRKKKRETLEYIEGCQKKLKKKVAEIL